MKNHDTRDMFYVTADAIVITESKPHKVLLIKRRANSRAFPNTWALPGGHVDYLDKSTLDAAIRELKEETGLTGLKKPLLLGVYDKPGRDPRGPYISVVYVFLVPNALPVKAADDAQDCGWVDVTLLPKLAFDHQDMIDDAVNLILFKDD